MTDPTPTVSDTAARARALLDAEPAAGGLEHVGWVKELIAAAPTLITDLLAEVDRLNARTPFCTKQELVRVLAERDAAVARADALDRMFVEVDGVEWCYVHEAEYVEGNPECGAADEHPCMFISLFYRAGDS